MRQDVVFFAWALAVGAGAVSARFGSHVRCRKQARNPEGRRQGRRVLARRIRRAAHRRRPLFHPRPARQEDLPRRSRRAVLPGPRRQGWPVKIITRQRVEAWVDKSELLPSAEAVEVFGKLIEKEPNNPRGYLGRAHAERGTQQRRRRPYRSRQRDPARRQAEDRVEQPRQPLRDPQGIRQGLQRFRRGAEDSPRRTPSRSTIAASSTRRRRKSPRPGPTTTPPSPSIRST